MEENKNSCSVCVSSVPLAFSSNYKKDVDENDNDNIKKDYRIELYNSIWLKCFFILCVGFIIVLLSKLLTNKKLQN